MPRPATAQESGGSGWSTLVGGALGLYAGATLASFGSLVPCTQSYPGPKCVGWSAAAGGAIAATGGLLLGGADAERLGDVALGTGIGFVAGGAVGLILRSQAQRFGWADVGTVGLLGGAIGSAPLGSAVGFGAGGVVGIILWLTVDGFESPDALGAAAAGLALGGLTQWLVRGIDSQGTGTPVLQVTVPLALEF